MGRVSDVGVGLRKFRKQSGFPGSFCSLNFIFEAGSQTFLLYGLLAILLLGVVSGLFFSK
jgi:hypothetical protein